MVRKSVEHLFDLPYHFGAVNPNLYALERELLEPALLTTSLDCLISLKPACSTLSMLDCATMLPMIWLITPAHTPAMPPTTVTASKGRPQLTDPKKCTNAGHAILDLRIGNR
uniref:Uncharacterized protein n=1 Tax=Romanomermis culicivorax TaxID=13658 RepID=A0A915J5M8_ROMCU